MRYLSLTALAILSFGGLVACSNAGTDPLNPFDDIDAGAVADSAGRVTTAVVHVQIDTVQFLEIDPEDADGLPPCTTPVLNIEDETIRILYDDCPSQGGVLNGTVTLTPDTLGEGGFTVEYDLVQSNAGEGNIDITGTTALTLGDDAETAIHDGRIKGDDGLTEITLDANDLAFPLASLVDEDTEAWPTGFYSGVARVSNLPIFQARLTFDGTSTVQVVIAGFDFNLDLETGQVSK